ncbi:MAG: peptidoglycan DD-metalloendopeptidase family protein [Chloroflexi bacterium]|nr:peptidoglycan DD-metalloendopeptidase family protein [Chloroflexota bacterium]
MVIPFHNFLFFDFFRRQRIIFAMKATGKRLFLVFLVPLLIGCVQPDTPEATPVAATTHVETPPTDSPTLTSTALPTTTMTPTPTATPSPTATPTATAPSIAVQGDPRAGRLHAPIPDPGAACGVVDLLDFPMDPPDGAAVSSGGRDFGTYRRRYEQYHAGEDWWQARGRSNFGLPVYSIGHGQVTYAESLGWGRDQGVVIVRHTFLDGSEFLSFYGHLDPPSVTLNAGDCVARGDKVGEIGRPRTPPHLHFEIRTHLPNEPGGGYWPEDPTLAGWLPPSQTIWHNRMATAPGVQWARPFVAAGSKGIGQSEPNAFIIIEDEQLVGLNAIDGAILWRHDGPDGAADALIDEARQIMFAINRRGNLAAYAIEENGGPEAEPLWQLDLDVVGGPTLLALPGGGAAVAVWQELFAVSAEGTLLWSQEISGRPFHRILFHNQLIYTTSGRNGGLWLVDEAGAEQWEGAGNGRLLVVGEQLWMYDDEGIFRLDPAARTVEPLAMLPRSYLGIGDILALPDGGALVAHRDRFDQRLLRFDAAGVLAWERSVAEAGAGQLSLLLGDGRPYLLSDDNNSGSGSLSVYAIDLVSSRLTHIFTGGAREPITADTWALPLTDELILLQVGGGSMVALDLRAAETAVQR